PPPPPLPPGAGPNLNRSSPASGPLGANISNLLAARKDMPITPSIKMKQLQWDKLPQQQVAKTLWSTEKPEQEKEMLQKLQLDGVWMEMEEDFKAKQLVINLMARQKRAELKSVLDPQTKKRVEILIQRVRKLQPEEIARKIQHFDQELCTQVFLSELKPVLPSPEQVGKLNVYRNADPEELAGLHPSDRLMVQLIQIDRLGPRIEGMLYKVAFDETWTLLDEGARKLSEAGRSLLDAKHLKELLSLILLIGNYMNGTGIKGGAFGFKVSSINKLVDTKSVNNTTLLHFLERTVARQFPAMLTFLDELEKPAEAYRVNAQELRKGLSELREGIKRIRQELGDHFADLSETDKYGKQMWSFVNKANAQLEDLVHDVNNAESTFIDAVSYYGEDVKNMTSSDFYGIFKTFVTSYKKCQMENQTAADEKAAVEKRKQTLEEQRLAREKAQDEKVPDESSDVLDSLMEKLRNGDPISRRAARRQPAAASAQPSAPLSLTLENTLPSGDDTANAARDLLAQLQSNGFKPPSPITTTAPRRRRRRTDTASPGGDMPGSPLATEIQHDVREESEGS
ncbi:hypothetical protein C0991_010942, partial [Blastosporella zonata]